MNAEEIARALGGRKNGKGWRALCPAHADTTPSLDIDIGDKVPVLLRCRAGCEQQAVIAKLREMNLWPERQQATAMAMRPKRRAEGMDRPAIAASVQDDNDGVGFTTPSVPAAVTATLEHHEHGTPTYIHEYFDAHNKLVGVVCRWEPPGKSKMILPAVPEGAGWRRAAMPAPRPLYGLGDVLAHPARLVLVVEGEKKCDIARELVPSHVIVTWAGGANAVEKTDFSPLKGRDVVLWPDNDEPGVNAMRAIAAKLPGARIVKLPPGLPPGWDLGDEIPPHLDIMALIREAQDPRAERLAGLGLVNAAELVTRQFRAPKWAVPDLVPEGLAILAGRPKTGKSWLGLDFAVAVASGGVALGNVACDQGDVLLLALEDTERRLHGRIKAVLQGQPAPARLSIATSWRKADAGGLDDLHLWLAAHHEARLVVIDTLQMIRGRPSRDEGVYASDYAAISNIKKIADQYAVPTMLVHHLRKDASGADPLDQVSGTAGLTGSADTILVLKREPTDRHALLYVRGRDVSEAEVAMQFDNATGKWLRLGAGEDFRKSEERRAIIRALIDTGPMTPNEVAQALGKKPVTIRSALRRMKEAGEIAAFADGKYGARE